MLSEWRCLSFACNAGDLLPRPGTAQSDGTVSGQEKQNSSAAFEQAAAEAQRSLQSCQAVAIAMGCDLPQGLLAATSFVALASASTPAASGAAFSASQGDAGQPQAGANALRAAGREAAGAESHRMAAGLDEGRQHAAAAAEAMQRFLGSTSTSGLQDTSGSMFTLLSKLRVSQPQPCTVYQIMIALVCLR